MTQQQPLVDLSKQLKQLSLSGMLESLPDRNQEALANQMSYQEFLSLLVGDELLVRENRRYERRYKQAQLDGNKTLETYDFTFNPMLNQKLVRDLATGHFVREKYPVIIVGPCGTGKTHLAQAIAYSVLQKGYNVLCTNQSKLGEQLQGAKASGEYRKKLTSLSRIDLLVIDDFGIKPLQQHEEEVLHDVITERYEKASTLITSNLATQEWPEAFSNKLLGTATIDRLCHNAYELILEGKSYRSLRKKGAEREVI